MAEEAGKASGIEKFDGTDFAYWRMQIEDYLYGRKLHLPLLGTKLREKTTADLMKALSGMYEKSSANNKVHLMKKLFNLKMAENASVAQHLNEFNTITNQLSSVEIDFDDEIRALIVLASLPNSWEAMRMAVSNSTGKEKLKYNDIRDLILAEEIRRRDADQIPEILIETEANLDQANKYNAGIVGKQVTLKGNAKALRRRMKMILLILYRRGDFGKVYLADGSALDVVGLGDVRISLPNGSVWLLEKVRHIPDLRRNLISIGQLDDEGHAILFVGGTWKVTKGARVLACGRRLGHMSEKGMKMLLSKGKLPELKSIDFDMCESCILGKQKKKWKVMVETETGLKVKSLRSDNGGEYIDGGFSEYCAAQGIRMEKTFLGTPQQNGVAERMNRTLNERARSMRLHAGLPKTFWADAVSTAAYLINRGPSVPMEFRLPEEVWSGKEVKFSHLKVFGCVSYVHIDSDARSKLDAKSKYVFSSAMVMRNLAIGSEKDKENVNSQVDLSTPVAEVRRSSRNIRPPQRYSPILNYLLLTDGGELECYDEALQDENSSKWELAMKDEMDSLLGNQTWELTELPVGKKALHNKWVYKIKNEHDGSKRYKARLVVKGFQQKESIDYTEIFSPVVKMSTIRLVLGMVAAENLHLEQLDVKTAFLHGDLEEDLYMIQPEGFIVQGQENLVCKLRKSLYGLKQAPRQWYKKFDNFMHRIGFKRCEADHCCYFKSFDNSYIILLLYVDDMLIAGSDIEKINNLKKQLSKQFAMKDLGAAKQILGMRIIRDKVNGTLKLSQSEYVKKVLSRPDIAHAVGVVSRFMSRPGKQHWEAIKWILRYLKGSLDTCLCFTGASLKLQGYVDADFAGDIDSRKSTTGFVFTLGGTAISWTSNLQKIVTLSTTEAEYVAATEAGKEMIGYMICGSKNPADMLTKGVTIEKLKLCTTSIGLLAEDRRMSCRDERLFLGG
ncbi:Retrovirus-related Pol polyprotein from transposon TNT 1-94 [Vitis vinifera]|uniref:Retrovirus-related Pol polyprotein from transposon TNT 1-94 n=1 Tax=Vitis vinifera TaxID=29760 RepID=A0A438CLT8_VITVI|nr:Retrovirus-related Pol polyprotein from transposon TNT 1-94 [Vitis vinifera]